MELRGGGFDNCDPLPCRDTSERWWLMSRGGEMDQCERRERTVRYLFLKFTVGPGPAVPL